MTPTERDRQDAAHIVAAVTRTDTSAFRSAFSAAVTRYGGLERLCWALAERAEKPE